jgi:hypothetical protein
MTSLAATLALHRELYAADLAIPKLVSRVPPTTLDRQTGRLHEEDGAVVGMSMSGRLLRYLSHPEGFGEHFPWSSALWRMKHHCRREHPYHRAADRPYWRGSLCWSLVIFTVTRDYSVKNAAKILRYDNPEPVLRYALAFIESEIDAARDRAIERDRILEAHVSPVGVAERVGERHDMGGLHREDCARCRRAA